MTPCKCGFSGCKRPAEFAAHKLFGKGGILMTCAKHKPPVGNERPAISRGMRDFYRVEAITKE